MNIPKRREPLATNLEKTFRALVRFAEKEQQEVIWEVVFIWIRSKEGGRHPSLGHGGDNSWCWDSLPEYAKQYA
ncbi:MAG TPA: hypothetical protein VH593_33205 [Ktedonobacteraceae bacterium]